jgi:hypothetical protein
MKVSIITATYNSSATLEDYLQSIHSQTHPHLEHISYPFPLKAVLGKMIRKKRLDKLQSFYYNVIHESSHGRRLLDQVNQGKTQGNGL